jgi:hypothetical protein
VQHTPVCQVNVDLAHHGSADALRLEKSSTGSNCTLAASSA